jgi:hypothetical protein
MLGPAGSPNSSVTTVKVASCAGPNAVEIATSAAPRQAICSFALLQFEEATPSVVERRLTG